MNEYNNNDVYTATRNKNTTRKNKGQNGTDDQIKGSSKMRRYHSIQNLSTHILYWFLTALNIIGLIASIAVTIYAFYLVNLQNYNYICLILLAPAIISCMVSSLFTHGDFDMDFQKESLISIVSAIMIISAFTFLLIHFDYSRFIKALINFGVMYNSKY